MFVNGQDVRVSGRLYKIARLDAEVYRYMPKPEDVIETLRRLKSGADVFTFTQRLSDPEPVFDYYFEKANYAVIEVSSYEQWWNKQIGFKARNKARQAEKKGVEIRRFTLDTASVEAIHAVYQETPIRQGRKFPHYGKSVEQVQRDLSTYPEDSLFIGAFFEGVMIGVVRLVLDDRREQAGLMTIVSMIAHRDKAPTNALVAKAVEVCAEIGVKRLFYSSYAYGNLSRDSLTDFKERNGFLRVEVPRYYVPLNLWGKIGLRLGMHHRLIDRIPESYSKKLREWRRKRNERMED